MHFQPENQSTYCIIVFLIKNMGVVRLPGAVQYHPSYEIWNYNVELVL